MGGADNVSDRYEDAEYDQEVPERHVDEPLSARRWLLFVGGLLGRCRFFLALARRCIRYESPDMRQPRLLKCLSFDGQVFKLARSAAHNHHAR